MSHRQPREKASHIHPQIGTKLTLHHAIRPLSWTARGFVSDAPPARNGSGKQLSLGEINSVSKERLMYRGDPVSESVCRILIVDDHRDMTGQRDHIAQDDGTSRAELL